MRNKIIPDFGTRHPGLRLTNLTLKFIQDYYTYDIEDFITSYPATTADAMDTESTQYNIKIMRA